jgi:hypothetical protein
MATAVRWLVAVALGVAVFEGLDAVAARVPMAGWLTWASPFIAGAGAAWSAGAGVVSMLLAAAAVPWGRIGVDRAIGALNGAQMPPEMALMVLAVFGLPWTGASFAGGLVVALARWTARRRTATG